MALLVLLNNFLHDLATGAWLSSQAFQLACLRGNAARNPEARAEMRRGLRNVRLVSRISLGWIVAGGIVRALTFRRYEWAEAAGRRQVVFLGVKHLLLFSVVWAGRRLEREVDRQMALNLAATAAEAAREGAVA